MSAVDVRTVDASTLVGIESTFGTTPSMTRIFPVADSMEISVSQAELENLDESVYLWDVKNPIQGLKEASAKFSVAQRADSTPLLTGATPATPWLGTLWKACLGGEHAVAGDTIASSSTTTLLKTSDGTKFLPTLPILCDVGNVPEPTWVSSIATNDVSLGLALSASPTTGQDIIQMYAYYPTSANTSTVTLQHALAGDSAHQWTLNGCIVDGQLKIERNKPLMADFALTGASWTGPSNQSITTAVGSDAMSEPFGVASGFVVLQSAAVTTRTHYPIHSCSIKFNHGMTHIEELAGTTQSRIGAFRTGQRLFAEIDLEIRSDLAIDTSYWTSRTDLQFMLAIPRGSGSTKQWFVVFAPKVIVVGKPQVAKNGGRMTSKFKLQTKIATSGAGANIPFWLAFG